MSTDLIEQIEAIIREHVSVLIAYAEAAGSVGRASRAISALIAEQRGRAFSEGQQVANGERRMCVNCGKTVPADRVKPGDVLTECIGPYGMAACTFDTTPQEAWEFWSKQWHELHQSLPAVRASARRKALEEAAASVDCGCECRPLVMMALTTSERAAQRVCTSSNTCCAIEAAAIRSLAAKEPTDGQ